MARKFGLLFALTVAGIVACFALNLQAQKRQIPIDTTEGTWMSLDVSPDGRQIVFDLLGDLYIMPISGGEAKRLTPTPKLVPVLRNVANAEVEKGEEGQAFDSQPRFSPDGQRIVFI